MHRAFSPRGHTTVHEDIRCDCDEVASHKMTLIGAGAPRAVKVCMVRGVVLKNRSATAAVLLLLASAAAAAAATTTEWW
jgi:hypothetical protein